MESEKIRSQVREFSPDEIVATEEDNKPPKLTEVELREWVERIDFEELGFENVDTEKLRLRKDGYLEDYHKYLKPRFYDQGLLEDVKGILVRKSIHVPYKLDPEQRILISLMANYYSIGSISECIGESASTCQRVTVETAIATAFVRGNTFESNKISEDQLRSIKETEKKEDNAKK